MYTATIVNKERVNGILVVGVTFTDGTNSVTENVSPQDEAGFNHWVKSRVTSLNSMSAFEAADNKDVALDLSEPVVAEQTEEEIAKYNWEVNFAKLQKAEGMKTLAAATGQAMTEEEVEAMAGLALLVKSTFKIEYLN